LPVAAAAASLGARDVAGMLVRGLDAKTWSDRAAAATGLGRMGKAGHPYLELLAMVLAAFDVAHRDVMPSTRTSSLHVAFEQALQAVGRHDIGAMLDLLDHENAQVRRAAFGGLEEHEPRRATDLTFERWPRMSIRQRAMAVRLLISKYTFYNPQTWPVIYEAFEDAQLVVRLHAAGAILRHSNNAAERGPAADLLVETYAAYPQPHGYTAYTLLTGSNEYGRTMEIVAAVKRALPGRDAETARRLREFVIDIENRSR